MISSNGSNKTWPEKGIKRRKISALCNNQTVQLSAFSDATTMLM
jgi:cyclin D6